VIYNSYHYLKCITRGVAESVKTKVSKIVKRKRKKLPDDRRLRLSGYFIFHIEHAVCNFTCVFLNTYNEEIKVLKSKYLNLLN